MDRLDIINHFVHKLNAEDYLEVGTFTGYTLDGCKAPNKLGVDPNCEHYRGINEVVCTTSDRFFATLPPDRKFQICFIDGLHESNQVLRDIYNCLNHLSEGGVIILHDLNPPTELHTTTGDSQGNWNGDCYKAAINIQANIGVDLVTVDTDWGVGILKPNPKDQWIPFYVKNYDGTWEYFNKYRKELLNLISPEGFLKREQINKR